MPDADLVLEGGGVKGLGTAHSARVRICGRLRADLIERGQATARDFLRRWNGAHP